MSFGGLNFDLSTLLRLFCLFFFLSTRKCCFLAGRRLEGKLSSRMDLQDSPCNQVGQPSGTGSVLAMTRWYFLPVQFTRIHSPPAVGNSSTSLRLQL